MPLMEEKMIPNFPNEESWWDFPAIELARFAREE